MSCYRFEPGELRPSWKYTNKKNATGYNLVLPAERMTLGSTMSTEHKSIKIQVNIVITRSLGSNKSNRVISESCYTKPSTRKRFQKRMSNNRRTIYRNYKWSCLHRCNAHVTAITYNNNNNIIK